MGKKQNRQEGYAVVSSDAEDDGDDEGGRPRKKRRGPSARKRLLIALALNLGYTLAELGAYYAFDSLAMLADAVHNLSDVVSIVIAWKIEGMKTASDRHRYTFGVKRAEVLGGVLNGTVLLALCFYVVCDAIPRLVDPPVMQITPLFIIVAAAGVPINLGTACLFIGSAVQPQHAHSHGSGGHGHAHGSDGKCPSEPSDGDEGNMNLWGVFLHNLGDALTSVGVTIVAVLLYNHRHEDEVVAGGCASEVLVFGSLDQNTSTFYSQPTSCGWTDFLDAGVSIFLSLVIALTVMPLLREGVPVLLDSSPPYVDLAAVRAELEALDAVHSVDALHVWRADRTRLVALVHASIDDRSSSSDRTGDGRDGAAEAIRTVLAKHDVPSTSVQVTSVNSTPRWPWAEVASVGSEIDRELAADMGLMLEVRRTSSFTGIESPKRVAEAKEVKEEELCQPVGGSPVSVRSAATTPGGFAGLGSSPRGTGTGTGTGAGSGSGSGSPSLGKLTGLPPSSSRAGAKGSPKALVGLLGTPPRSPKPVADDPRRSTSDYE